MKGHRRDQSESNVPLKPAEIQASFDNNEVRFHSNSECTTSNGVVNSIETSNDASEGQDVENNGERNSKVRFKLLFFLFLGLFYLHISL